MVIFASCPFTLPETPWFPDESLYVAANGETDVMCRLPTQPSWFMV